MATVEQFDAALSATRSLLHCCSELVRAAHDDNVSAAELWLTQLLLKGANKSAPAVSEILSVVSEVNLANVNQPIAIVGGCYGPSVHAATANLAIDLCERAHFGVLYHFLFDADRTLADGPEWKDLVEVAWEDVRPMLMRPRMKVDLAIAFAEKEATRAIAAYAITQKPRPRITVSVDPPQVVIDGAAYAIKPKMAEFFEAMVVASGDYVSMSSHGIRSRDTESLPKEVQAIIDTQPGSGSRIPR